MCTWEEIGEKWVRAQSMGFQAIQAAMDVGEELQRKKIEIPVGDFSHACEVIGLKRDMRSRLMRMALHRETIEQARPDSMRGALALLPKVPKKVSEKQMTVHKEEVDKYEEFAKEPAKKQAAILAKKMVKVELDRLQAQAHDAVMKELNAAKSQLKKERKRTSDLMASADEKRQFYHDLINQKMNGYDYRCGMKTLKQALHPDRATVSPGLQNKAMVVLQHLERFLQL